MQKPAILICVGATKAGTSWLHKQLAAHPQCYFRTIKELHYFDAVQFQQTRRRIIAHEDELKRLGAKLMDAPDEATQRRLRRRIADIRDWLTVLSHRGLNADAYTAYLMSDRKDQRIVGDFTPSYATVSADMLVAMAGIAADVKVLYLLRDPVARMWSHIRMQVRQSTNDPSVIAAKVSQRFDTVVTGDRHMGGRGDYAAAIEKLRAAIAPERLSVRFSEDLMTPDGMGALWSFLDLPAGKCDFERRVHAGVSVSMTDDQRVRARAALRAQYNYVANAFPSVPLVWRENMKEATL
jgi:hypothetical protein